MPKPIHAILASDVGRASPHTAAHRDQGCGMPVKSCPGLFFFRLAPRWKKSRHREPDVPAKPKRQGRRREHDCTLLGDRLGDFHRPGVGGVRYGTGRWHGARRWRAFRQLSLSDGGTDRRDAEHGRDGDVYRCGDQPGPQEPRSRSCTRLGGSLIGLRPMGASAYRFFHSTILSSGEAATVRSQRKVSHPPRASVENVYLTAPRAHRSRPIAHSR
jgi:hypothetical protein